MLINGLDVSSQTQQINYKLLKENNIDFVMLRAGFTDYDKNKTKRKDKLFNYNYKLAKKYRLNIGVYYTSNAVTLKEAKEEIDYFLNIIKDKVFDYPVTIQIEDDHNTIIYYPKNQKNLDKKDLLNISLFMINQIKINGYEPLIRTYYNWYVDVFKENKKYLYWIDNSIDNSNYINSYDNDILYLNTNYKINNDEKVEIVLEKNSLLDTIKNYIKAGYKILKSKIRKI